MLDFRDLHFDGSGSKTWQLTSALFTIGLENCKKALLIPNPAQRSLDLVLKEAHRVLSSSEAAQGPKEQTHLQPRDLMID